MDKVMCLSRQKLRAESARDEPDLRKLLAHVCTVEHIQDWLRSNPPKREAPSPPQDFEVDVHEGDNLPPLCKVETVHSISSCWSPVDLRDVVTAVREVEADDDTNDEDSDDSSVGEEIWGGSDTSDETDFGKYTTVDALKGLELIDYRFPNQRASNDGVP